MLKKNIRFTIAVKTSSNYSSSQYFDKSVLEMDVIILFSRLIYIFIYHNICFLNILLFEGLQCFKSIKEKYIIHYSLQYSV